MRTGKAIWLMTAQSKYRYPTINNSMHLDILPDVLIDMILEYLCPRCDYGDWPCDQWDHLSIDYDAVWDADPMSNDINEA